MEDTTTSTGNGADNSAQPTQTDEAVTLGESGAPTLRPKVAETSPQSQTANVTEPDQPAEEPTTTPDPAETQAEDDTSDINAWAEKKGIDLKTVDPVKLAQMVRESEKRMHEATAQARELETTMAANPGLEYTGDEAYDQLALEVNQIKIQNRVEAFFRANPDAREQEQQMIEIVKQRPWLQNDLEALHALAVNSPSRSAELKSEGGREALTNIAQKMSAVPPPSNASTGATSTREVITPENVDALVAKNGQEWFKKNYDSINKAMAGTR